jgi:PAS domain S-box-containing protein
VPPDPLPIDPQSPLAVGGVSALVISMLVLLGRTVGPRILRKLSNSLDKLADLPDKVEVLSEKLTKVEKATTEACAQLQLNGGSTVADGVKANTQAIKDIVETIRNRDKTLDQVCNTVNELKDMLMITDARAKVTWQADEYATFECGPTGECVMASDALAELFGLPTDQLLGEGWLQALPTAEERIRVKRNWDECRKERIPYIETYFIKHRPTGEVRRIRVQARGLYSAEGKPRLFFGFCKQIGDQDS